MSILLEQDLDIKSKLKEVFGFANFRGNQEDIITALIENKNVFVIMPTGAGKSMCYQLPALMKEGTALIVSPLIALMKNQVDQLSAFEVNALFLNSTLSKAEITKVKKEVLNGDCKLLYVAPESLSKEENMTFMQSANISFVAIDEAHCISEWGHDFRPEYRKIKSIVETLGNPPLIALTATATPKVQIDIQKNLQMEDALIFKSSFNRKNLYYEVRPKTGAKKQLIRYIKQNTGKSGIIYCLSRRKVEEIAELLKVNGIKALPYHAGLESEVRMYNQDAFLNEEVDVIVATIAFGMGIDKPDVRFVIHYDAPKSLEGYYQETGRAGRDGMEGNCLMFYSYDDIEKLEKFNKDKTVSERDNAKLLLTEMTAFAETSMCRRRFLLNYFGETLDKDCGFCDNCLKPKEKFAAMEEMLLALNAVLETEETFGIDHLSDVLRGIDNEYVKSHNQRSLPVFGKGKDKNYEFWSSIYRQALVNGYLEKDVENIGVLKLTEKGENFIDNPHEIHLSKDHDYSNSSDEDADIPDVVSGANKSFDPVLLDMLKNLRKKVAKEKNVPPYVIFQDTSLEEMSTVYPITIEDLSHVNGVGMSKATKFGKPFTDLITKYVDENDIVTANDVVVKSSVNKSKTKIFIIQQIDRKVDLEEIAEAKELNMEELLDEVEHICFSGTKLNIDYYIDQVIDTDKQDQIYQYFMTSESDNVAKAVDELGEDYTAEEIRLMRIKFISEVAM
ncbi:MAG: DNA helicase RecQ [Cytophagales bacterium]|nr:DNA helicase RecQ [Cytophagales bacterium]